MALPQTVTLLGEIMFLQLHTWLYYS